MLHEDAPPGAHAGSAPGGAARYLAATLGFLTVLIDGFDTQSAAFAGPLLKHEFAGGAGALGMIFGLGMAGGLVGAFVLGPLGDKFGRRPLVIVSLLLMAAGSALSAHADSARQLAMLRFLTGVGLGGAVPTVLALVAEFASEKWRSMTIAIVFNGFPLGAMLGSIIGARLLPELGWRSFFTLGAALPAILLLFVIFLLPESLQFGIRKRALRSARAEPQSTIRRAADDHRTGAAGSDLLQSLTQMFSTGLRWATILVWGSTFLSVLSLYCTVNFLPTLISDAGLPLKIAILSVAALNVGSVVGNLILARVADRGSPYILTATFYGLGAIALASIASATYSSALILALAFCAGLLAFGAQLSLTTITTRLYPVEIRSTGVGFAFGVGRVGGAVGPFAAGLLLDLGTSFGLFMAEIAGMFALAGVGVLLLRRTAPAVRDGVAIMAR